MNDLNEKLKGTRGLILTWLSALAIFLDQLQPLVDQLLSSNVSVAVAMSVVMSAKLVWTDLLKRLKK